MVSEASNERANKNMDLKTAGLVVAAIAISRVIFEFGRASKELEIEEHCKHPNTYSETKQYCHDCKKILSNEVFK